MNEKVLLTERRQNPSLYLVAFEDIDKSMVKEAVIKMTVVQVLKGKMQMDGERLLRSRAKE